ncbi:MAG: hypothetical protein WBX25_07590 [Rhodomicrobium sp.]
MLIPGIIIFLALFTGIAAVKGYEQWEGSTTNFIEKLAICIIAVAVLGFFEPFWIRLFPRELLDHFELPNTIGAIRLTAPDGRVFIVSSAILRVQRYGPEGFEKGFLVGGKVSSSAMSLWTGNILVCSPGGELRTYTPDGDEVLPRGLCRGGFARSFFSYPSKAKVPVIAFNWFSALAVPLWHPFAAWVVALFGGLLFKVSSSDEWWDAPESNPGGRGSSGSVNRSKFYTNGDGPPY